MGNQSAQVADLTASQAGESRELPTGGLKSLAAGPGHLGQVENLPDFARIQDGSLHPEPAEDRAHLHHPVEPQGLPRFKHLQALAHHSELLADFSQVPGGDQPVKPLGPQGTIGKPGDDPLQVSIVQDIQVGNGH